MTLNIPKGIPAHVAKQAAAIYSQWRQGNIRPRKARCDRQFLTLEVGRSHRLLSKRGTEWKLMSHEKYNKELK